MSDIMNTANEMNLVVIGSVALDSVRAPGGSVEDALGGSATFFSLAARLLSPVGVVAVVGEDFPAEYRDLLRDAGVNLEGLVARPGRTFRWSGEYGEDPNERTTLETQLNVFADFQPDLLPAHRSADWVFLGNIDPHLQLAVLDQVDAPRFVACDTMNLWIENASDALARTLERVDLLFLNDEEARQWTGCRNLFDAGRAILDQGPSVVVVKKGEHGAILLTSDEVFVAPAFPLSNVVDPTGAGDSFAGAFMGCLVAADSTDSSSLRRAMVHGTAAASFCVEGLSVSGLSGRIPADLHRRLQEYGETVRYEI